MLNLITKFTKILTLYIFLLAFLFPVNLKAIVMRHDIDSREYLLDTLEYQSTIVINGCTATLIAPRWVLTAAHCVYPSNTTGNKAGDALTLTDENIIIRAIHSHPEHSQEGVLKHDIALIELSEPSFSILPTPLYEDENEQGKVMKLAGYGVVGDGIQGIYDRCFPCELRGADNKVEEANNYQLRFRFDSPNGSNSLPLEGVGAGGDSGGPAFIETESGRYVAGVSSFGSKKYNEFDNYTRVSKELNWLVEIMADDYQGNYAGLLYSELNTQSDLKEKIENSGGSFSIILLVSLMLTLRGQRM